jgi:hypothetical protein
MSHEKTIFKVHTSSSICNFNLVKCREFSKLNLNLQIAQFFEFEKTPYFLNLKKWPVLKLCRKNQWVFQTTFKATFSWDQVPFGHCFENNNFYSSYIELQ